MMVGPAYILEMRVRPARCQSWTMFTHVIEGYAMLMF
jgi:hypothetical protein